MPVSIHCNNVLQLCDGHTVKIDEIDMSLINISVNYDTAEPLLQDANGVSILLAGLHNFFCADIPLIFQLLKLS